MLAAFLLCTTSNLDESDGLRFLTVVNPTEVSRSFSSTGVIERVYQAGPIDPGFDWTELVPSWNLENPGERSIGITVSLVKPDLDTKWYSFGTWSLAGPTPRTSMKDQADAKADVETDTLVAKEPARSVWVRVAVSGPQANALPAPFVGLSFRDARKTPPPEDPNREAWGKTIEVPQRSQMSYPGGNVLCSPTSVSMMLAHWAKVLGKGSLDKDVPEVQKGVFDPNWPGTGNWPFNTAYAGSFPELRAYVTRFGSVREVEDWVAAGIPVVTSVSLAMLKGKPNQEPNDGHLVIVVGFTADGDPVFNDPGRSTEVRQIYKRAHFEASWRTSGNTVYLIYPKKMSPPKDRLGHWMPKEG